MGWFRKKDDSRDGGEELAELRAEIRQLREQVDQADQTNAALAKQLAERIAETDLLQARSDEQLAAFDARRSQLESQLAVVGSAHAELAAELDDVRATLADQHAAHAGTHRAALTGFPAPTTPPFDPTDLANRLEDLQAAVAGHHAQLAGLTEANRVLAELRDRLGDVHDLRTRLDDTVQHTDDLRAEVVELDRRYRVIDDRITQTSTELAAQLTELGNEVDELQTAPAGPDADREDDTDEAAGRRRAALDDIAIALDALQTAQERLASEQARYQIQFRKDLAELADRSGRAAG
jgi:chromosome segregation ATPase